MNILINSFNSPIKLKALLDSIEIFYRNHPQIYVRLSVTDDIYQDGYDKLFSFYKNIIVTTEENVDYIVKSKPKFMLLSDTNLFTRQFRINLDPIFNNPTILTFSTVLGSNLYDAPKITMYNYRNYKNHFGDPWLYGNIWRSEDVLNKEFIPTNRNQMFFNTQSCVIDVYTHQTDKYLNEQFLNGKEIDFNPFMFMINKDIRVITDYNLRWRT